MSGGEINYRWLRAEEIDDALLAECSGLFSAHYGIWGASGPRPGQPVSLKPSALRRLLTPRTWAAIARHPQTDQLLAYAFALRDEMEGAGPVTWVTQLVVHREYRNMGIAKRLLFSLWSFSDQFAWGLVTSNPYAVRALEKATRRRCDPAEIARYAADLKRVADQIEYIKDAALRVNEQASILDTAFFVDHSELTDMLENVTCNAKWHLGPLNEGEEWFAFTFQAQREFPLDPDELAQMLRHSDQLAREAYGRMKLDEHHLWARHTESEVAFAETSLGLSPEMKVLDFGCGAGRHALALGRLGYQIVGVDFVSAFVNRASAERDVMGVHRASFVAGDCRDVDLGQSFDRCLCLYDVIGSFPEQEENIRILANAARHLKPGGLLLASVMNLELTRAQALNVASIREDPNALLRIPPSRTMQDTGNIFDPRLYVLDPEGIVYRKEQFDFGDHLPRQFIVRDRRYTIDGIREMCAHAGLRLFEEAGSWPRYVQAGRWERPLSATDQRAKEILFLASKPEA